MPGRFPLFLDACVRGAVAHGLLRRGWDAVRTVDLHGEGAKPLHQVALQWLRAGRAFRMVYWTKNDDQRFTAGQILDAFDGLAERDDPFRYPVYYLKPKA